MSLVWDLKTHFLLYLNYLLCFCLLILIKQGEVCYDLEAKVIFQHVPQKHVG